MTKKIMREGEGRESIDRPLLPRHPSGESSVAKKNQVEVEEAGGVLEIAARGEDGQDVDTGVLEEAGMAFDPTTMHLDLTRAQKRRTTALMLAIQAYDKLIIKDAEYLREAHSQARLTGSVIRPATMDAMVVAALQFDAFISDGMALTSNDIGRSSQTDVPASDEPQSGDAVDPQAPK